MNKLLHLGLLALVLVQALAVEIPTRSVINYSDEEVIIEEHYEVHKGSGGNEINDETEVTETINFSETFDIDIPVTEEETIEEEESPAPSPSPVEEEESPAPSPSPVEEEESPAPSPSPVEEESTFPAPGPTEEATVEEESPIPSPSPVEEEESPAPSPSPVEEESTFPAPGPTEEATDEEESPIPSPSPIEEEESPAPSPSPVEEEESPALSPSPVEEEESPAPSPSPVEEEESPAPSPSPVEEEESPTPSPSPVEEEEETTPQPPSPPKKTKTVVEAFWIDDCTNAQTKQVSEQDLSGYTPASRLLNFGIDYVLDTATASQGLEYYGDYKLVTFNRGDLTSTETYDYYRYDVVVRTGDGAEYELLFTVRYRAKNHEKNVIYSQFTFEDSDSRSRQHVLLSTSKFEYGAKCRELLTY